MQSEVLMMREPKYVSFEERMALVKALDDSSDKGELTWGRLAEAIFTQHDNRDYIPESIGTTWIEDNPQAFKRAVNSNVLGFLREYMDTPHFAEIILLKEDVLKLIPEAERAEFVRVAYLRHGARNFGWVKAADSAHVCRDAIQEIILESLRRVDPAQIEKNILTAAHEFLEYGDGMGSNAYHEIEIQRNQRERGIPDSDLYYPRFSAEYPWGILTDAQFEEALEICAEKMPGKVISMWEKLCLRLSRETVRAICNKGIGRLKSFCGKPLDFQWLAIENRLALAESLQPLSDQDSYQSSVMEFLLDCFFEIPAHDQPVFWYKVIERVLENANGVEIYRTFKKRIDWLSDDDWHLVMDSWMNARLEASGYRIGTIEEGTFFDRKRRQNRLQFQVQHGRKIYIQDRFSHRYFPRKGDRVFYRPATAQFLTPMVAAVHFIPVDPNRER
ncbi:hypothetical protein KKC32_04830 [Patescibacteria group bacterium]|nr:hypothetical protein [Patescibacteria group bacterium]